ncbi:MAG TPA: UDP-glucose/GDP-mannose dehydrogenase family protein [Myxococcales bacterium]|nr:UDP-glucose/GDP-mannose dehydrogenase family protein [Myxococcales bacterium]HIN85426.1 UDP-glucose/GDP-mannose dehydrogenase family protein [Myxococcales bacterium]
MNIAVMGSGYVGLVVGACLSELGNQVTCVDINAQKVAMLNNGQIPIYEPGLSELVLRNKDRTRLSFTTDAAIALNNAQIVFIAVGTPEDEDGSADLSHVEAVSQVIGQYLRHPNALVVIKSTVPIGTNARVKSILEGSAQVPFHVVSNPEFLKEGAAIGDFMKPARIVVGSDAPGAAQLMDSLYAPLVRTGAPIFHMDVASAEMTKYAANAMLATRISFMNEIANLCDKVGADVAQVRRGIGSDPRIGKSFLFPGVGYGGSCFPKDVRALVRTAATYGVRAQILSAVDEVNEAQKRVLVAQVHQHFGADLSALKFALWGLAFKAQTDDIREAPALVIVEALLTAGAEICVFDPQAIEPTRRVLGDRVSYGSDLYDPVADADGLLVVTDWNEFRQPDFARVFELMGDNPVLFDGRNLYDPSEMRSIGFEYFAMGRTSVGRA